MSTSPRILFCWTLSHNCYMQQWQTFWRYAWLCFYSFLIWYLPLECIGKTCFVWGYHLCGRNMICGKFLRQEANFPSELGIYWSNEVTVGAGDSILCGVGGAWWIASEVLPCKLGFHLHLDVWTKNSECKKVLNAILNVYSPSTSTWAVIESYSLEAGPMAQLAQADCHAPATIVSPACFWSTSH